jgi:RNA polymerase sigma-70 factor, ECF subfamily
VAKLSQVWRDHLGHDPCSEASDTSARGDALETELEHWLRQCKARWPGVHLDDEGAVAFLAQRVALLAPEKQHPHGLHGEDLWLCCACLNGDATAARRLREELKPTVKGALARYADPHFSDEVFQSLMVRMLVADEGQLPHLAKYKGTGKLGSWIRIAALREASNLLRRTKREVPSEVDTLVERVVSVADPNLNRLKDRYRALFKKAFQQAFSSLSVRQRNVLRHQYLEGLNLEGIAALYGAARSTAAYWRSGAKEDLFKQTRRFFKENLGADNAEFDGIMQLIESQLEVSMSRILRETPKPSADTSDKSHPND